MLTITDHTTISWIFMCVTLTYDASQIWWRVMKTWRIPALQSDIIRLTVCLNYYCSITDVQWVADSQIWVGPSHYEYSSTPAFQLRWSSNSTSSQAVSVISYSLHEPSIIWGDMLKTVLSFTYFGIYCKSFINV